MPYIPHTPKDIETMLSQMGKSKISELFADIPQDLKIKEPYDIPESLTEIELVNLMSELANRNVHLEQNICFMGGGMYDHFIPVLVDYLTSRSEFMTSYTPYQPETSQGNLQVMFEYQSAICELTGLDISNASLYDGHTALAEAILMAYSFHRRKKNTVLLCGNIHPEYLEVAKTYLQYLPMMAKQIDCEENGLIALEDLEKNLTEDVCCVVIQSPNFFGLIEDGEAIASVVRKTKASLVSIVNPISLGLLQAPGDYDADIALGEGQPLGIPLSYGGPSFGFFAAKKEYIRHMPGRMAGQALDSTGRKGYVLTLQTREQHIRREKATSNICTNQALMALRGLVYLSCIGPEGLREIADHSMQKAHYLAEKLNALDGFSLSYKSPFFHEFIIRCPVEANKVLELLEANGIFGGIALARWFPDRANEIMIAVTECRTRQQMDKYIDILANQKFS